MNRRATSLHRFLTSPDTAALAGIITLAAGVATGLRFVSATFSGINGPSAAPWLGWVSALAIEGGVLFLGLTVAARAAQGDRNVRLMIMATFFIGLSAIANFDHVLAALTGGPVTWQALEALDRWTLVKAAALGGAVPLVVLAALEALRELASAAHDTSGSVEREAAAVAAAAFRGRGSDALINGNGR